MRMVHAYDYPLLPSMRYGVNKKEKRKRRRRGLKEINRGEIVKNNDLF
jgi:hypothetical protein